jgi:hypothetical protein
MLPNDAAAQALVATLRAAGIHAQIREGGAPCPVQVAPVGSRAIFVHCFWYERTLTGSHSARPKSALVLGMNPANARTRLTRVPVRREELEYFVILQENGVRVADGRTVVAEEVVACAQAWLAAVELDALARAVPFVDRKRRAIRAIAARLGPRVRWDLEADPAYEVWEVWAYGDGRSCKLAWDDHVVACGFFVGQAQVAFAQALDDVGYATSAWLLEALCLRELAARVRGVELERHAEILEVDPARWHWLHVRDRMADPADVLAPQRELLEELAASSVASAFYTYSSLNRLCFSASSHFPWVDQGLPIVTRDGDGPYGVGNVRCGLARAKELIESALAAHPIRPFFGSAPHHECRLIAEHLARQGTALRPRLEQHRQYYDLVVASGARRCVVSHGHVRFTEAERHLNRQYLSVDDTVAAISRFLERGASFDDLAPN